MPVGTRSPPRSEIDEAELDPEVDLEVDPERVISLDCA